jgi:hypothetical protein
VLKVAVAFCCVIWFVGGSAAATDAASPTWIGKRVNMWIKLCPATAPSFAGFATAVRKNGFRPNRNGMFNYKETEIVASLKKTAKGCACQFSFGTDNPNLAGSMVAKAMVSQFKSRFQPDDNPRSLGELATADGKLPVTAKSWKAYGGDWIGLIIHGKRSCPSH